MRAQLAAALLLASCAAHAATIGGQLSYPSEDLPAMYVVARNAEGATRHVETKAGQRRYRIEVPAGTYVFFAIPIGVGGFRDQPPPRGAYTEYTVCGQRDKAKMEAGGCKTGALVPVRVEVSDQRDDIDLNDWYMPDALAATLNLAIAEPRAPQGGFDAYPADTTPPAATRPIDFESAHPLVKNQRSTLQRAASRGPFLAGHVAVARWGCGMSCEAWALVDIASGRISVVEGLHRLRGGLPCPAEALEFRDDSRLLRVHRAEGGRVLTQDYLWSGERLEAAAASSQSAAEFCAVRMR